MLVGISLQLFDKSDILLKGTKMKINEVLLKNLILYKSKEITCTRDGMELLGLPNTSTEYYAGNAYIVALEQFASVLDEYNLWDHLEPK